MSHLTPLYAPLSGFLPQLEVGLSVSGCSSDARKRFPRIWRGSAADHSSLCSISEVRELTLLTANPDFNGTT